jgi:hypothetical protein
MAKYQSKDFVSEWYRIDDRELPLICEALDLLIEKADLSDKEIYIADELRCDLINAKSDSKNMKKLIEKWKNAAV